MKKKISVFTLLLSLFLCFGCSFNAFAQTDSTDIFDDWCYANNLPYNFNKSLTDDELNKSIHYVVFSNPSGTNSYYVLRLIISDDYCKPYFSGERFNFNVLSCTYGLYWNSNDLWNSCMHTPQLTYYTYIQDSVYKIHEWPIVFSTLDIYTDSSCSELLFKRSDNAFSFYYWCNDAGLECKSSKYESQSVIPYSYNDYWHIVRKSYDGKWLLTTIGNSVMQENIDDYKLYVGENSNLHVASIYGGEDPNGYILNVHQYVYDTDGWKLSSYEIFDSTDYSGVVDLGADTGFDDTRKLAFTNVDIFVGSEYEPTYPKSTEYYEVTITPPVEEPEEPDSPTPIPTTAPDNDSSGGGRPGSGSRPDTGGQATGGGGLDFIINLFTLIWTKICSIPMAVDGYSINLQQIVIYGALVSIVGGFIMHFIFGRK